MPGCYSKIGHLYGLKNDAMQGMCKVGMTYRTPEERANELSRGTAVPLQFDVVCTMKVENPKEKEAILHEMLGKSHERVSANREFFRVSPKELRTVFERMKAEWSVEVRAEEEEDERTMRLIRRRLQRECG